MRRDHHVIRSFFDAMDDSFFEEYSVADNNGFDRHFDDSEQEALSADARGYLLDLYRQQQISRLQMELIIHYAVTFQREPMTRADLVMLMDLLLFSTSDDRVAGDFEGPVRKSH
jgi:uncharacterized protein Smg (DUF494 family)